MEAVRRLALGPFVARYFPRRGSRSDSSRQAPLAVDIWVCLPFGRVSDIASWLLRYLENLRSLVKREKPAKSVESVPSSSLPLVTVDEMDLTELEILKSVQKFQKFNFQEDLELLNKSESNGHVKKSISLRWEIGLGVHNIWS